MIQIYANNSRIYANKDLINWICHTIVPLGLVRSLLFGQPILHSSSACASGLQPPAIPALAPAFPSLAPKSPESWPETGHKVRKSSASIRLAQSTACSVWREHSFRHEPSFFPNSASRLGLSPTHRRRRISQMAAERLISMCLNFLRLPLLLTAQLSSLD